MAKPDLRARLRDVIAGRDGTPSDIDPDILNSEQKCYRQLIRLAYSEGQPVPLASELLPPLP